METGVGTERLRGWLLSNSLRLPAPTAFECCQAALAAFAGCQAVLTALECWSKGGGGSRKLGIRQGYRGKKDLRGMPAHALPSSIHESASWLLTNAGEDGGRSKGRFGEGLVFAAYTGWSTHCESQQALRSEGAHEILTANGRAGGLFGHESGGIFPSAAAYHLNSLSLQPRLHQQQPTNSNPLSSAAYHLNSIINSCLSPQLPELTTQSIKRSC
eukprot:1157003-Pelagomonas_calceolata.AAC.4